jgi:hypothetical protein
LLFFSICKGPPTNITYDLFISSYYTLSFTCKDCGILYTWVTHLHSVLRVNCVFVHNRLASISS